MTIDLKSLDFLGASREFQIDIFKLDADRDNTLDGEDLARRYGSTAAQRHGHDLETAIRQNDPKAFAMALGKMAETRNQVVGKLFAEEMRRMGLGVTASEESMVAPLRNALTRESIVPGTAHEKSFPIYLDCTSRNDETPSLEMIGRIAMEIYAGPILDTYDQDNMYAPTQYYELRQPAVVGVLEAQYALDIRTDGAPLTAEEGRILGEVLADIRSKRPKDLALLKTLVLIHGNSRGTAYASDPDEITIYGPFAPPAPVANIPGQYAEESLVSARTFSAEPYLHLKLIHELGHLVAHRDGEKTGGFNVPLRYELLAPAHAHEWFAEDYALFIASGGKKVMGKTIGGEEVPNDEQRLEFMRTHYPLSRETQFEP